MPFAQHIDQAFNMDLVHPVVLIEEADEIAPREVGRGTVDAMTLETVESGWIGELDPVDRSGRNKPSCGRGTLAAIDDDEMLNGLVGLPGDAFECRFQQGIARRVGPRATPRMFLSLR